MITIPEVITQLLIESEGVIDVKIQFNPRIERIEFVVDGFYKSGTCTLCEVDGKLIAHTRYDGIDVIETLEDLVKLNLSWHEYSQDRYAGWAAYDPSWNSLIEKYREE